MFCLPNYWDSKYRFHCGASLEAMIWYNPDEWRILYHRTMRHRIHEMYIFSDFLKLIFEINTLQYPHHGNPHSVQKHNLLSHIPILQTALSSLPLSPYSIPLPPLNIDFPNIQCEPSPSLSIHFMAFPPFSICPNRPNSQRTLSKVHSLRISCPSTTGRGWRHFDRLTDTRYELIQRGDEQIGFGSRTVLNRRH